MKIAGQAIQSVYAHREQGWKCTHEQNMKVVRDGHVLLLSVQTRQATSQSMGQLHAYLPMNPVKGSIPRAEDPFTKRVRASASHRARSRVPGANALKA